MPVSLCPLGGYSVARLGKWDSLHHQRSRQRGTAFHQYDPALYSNLTFSVETQQSYRGTNVSSYFAVQVGGAWYVSPPQ